MWLETRDSLASLVANKGGGKPSALPDAKPLGKAAAKEEAKEDVAPKKKKGDVKKKGGDKGAEKKKGGTPPVSSRVDPDRSDVAEEAEAPTTAPPKKDGAAVPATTPADPHEVMAAAMAAASLDVPDTALAPTGKGGSVKPPADASAKGGAPVKSPALPPTKRAISPASSARSVTQDQSTD